MEPTREPPPDRGAYRTSASRRPPFVIERPWSNRGAAVVVALFAALAAAEGAAWLSALIEGRGTFRWGQAAAGGVVLVALGYLILAVTMNRARLTVRDGALHVEQRPFPLVRDRTVSIDTVDRLVLRRRDGGEGPPYWELEVTTDGGEPTHLMRFPSLEAGEAVRDALAKELGM